MSTYYSFETFWTDWYPRKLRSDHKILHYPRQCLKANDGAACVPNGGVLPGSGVQCAVSYAPCTHPPVARQRWRLTSVDEIQSAPWLMFFVQK